MLTCSPDNMTALYVTLCCQLHVVFMLSAFKSDISIVIAKCALAEKIDMIAKALPFQELCPGDIPMASNLMVFMSLPVCMCLRLSVVFQSATALALTLSYTVIQFWGVGVLCQSFVFLGGPLPSLLDLKNYTPVDPKQFVLFKSKLELATSRAGRQV